MHPIFRSSVRAQILFFILSLLNASLVYAGAPKQLALRQAENAIRIDGAIDDRWSKADSVSDFVQYAPYHGSSPTLRTVAKILTTESSLYCLMVCYADPERIQRTTGVLDEAGGDIVSIMLDTFGDKKTAYKFAVTASGVRNDCRLLDDGRNRDYGWDGVWFSSARIYPWGFAIEIEIPYRSIQYDPSLDAWGLDFDRWIPDKNEDIYWCAYEQNEGQRISKFGSLVLGGFRPGARSLNLELYPVGLMKTSYLRENVYRVSPDAGIDVFYNPSPRLTFQMTARPDFAQIEADPFTFNISRYETYFNERRPFFTQGNEIFMASGKQRNSGFYQPLELFYSRRIGKKFPDGSEVPLLLGTKLSGRAADWEYGGFLARTGRTSYDSDGENRSEDAAYFTTIRIKKQVFGNSSAGLLFSGKFTGKETFGVIDFDGALRASDWQLSYQVARSYSNGDGDFAASAGFNMLKESWLTLFKGRFVGNSFDISEVGYVPWKGTANAVGLTGPRWYFPDGNLQEITVYTGVTANYERADEYTDLSVLLGLNVQFRSNWGGEVNYSLGPSKDQGARYTSNEFSFSSWFNIDPAWYASVWCGISRSYNFSRNWVASYSWAGTSFGWNALNILSIGTSFNSYIESDPSGHIADITYNARPFFTLTPVNDVRLYLYIDNVYFRSTGRLEQLTTGFLFSYNFLPKSWIYLAINDIRDRSDQIDASGMMVSGKLHVLDQAAVLKMKYLYYF